MERRRRGLEEISGGEWTCFPVVAAMCGASPDAYLLSVSSSENGIFPIACSSCSPLSLCLSTISVFLHLLFLHLSPLPVQIVRSFVHLPCVI